MTTYPAPAIEFALRFEQSPSMRVISSTRRYVEELFTPLVGPDVAARTAMVAHELLENVAKYASEGPACLEATAVPERDADLLVRVSTVNRVAAHLVADLRGILNEVSSSSNPHALYLSYMQASVKRGQGSRLGLIRVRAEGEMSLRHTLVDNEIAIHAEGVVPRVG